jgi:hypothetical protein
MVEHGAVTGSTIYPERHRARWRARSLIGLMVEFRLRERWELREPTERKDGGWTWTVEWLGSRR